MAERRQSARMHARLEMPRPSRSMLLRARLLTRLQERWERRVLVVSAGPGFGKTTLLAQAFGENALAPSGEDVWVSCHADDAVASSLLATLSEALGLKRTAHAGTPTVAPLVEAIAARAPVHVCLMLDDVHVVPTGSSGADALASLIADLPANGHVVLSGRGDPPLRTARLRAAGTADRLGEQELAFTAEEIAAFASLRSVPSEALAPAGRWPALAELAASTDRGGAADYLWEEVLEGLPADQRRSLAVLAAVGRADDGVITAALGTQVRVRDLTRGVPLTTVTDDGWATLHDLWRPALEHELTREERADVRRRAAATFRERGDVGQAARLYAEAEDWAALRDLAMAVCSDSHPLVDTDVLAIWHAHLAHAGEASSAEALLLQGAIRKPHDPLASVPFFQHAARAFRSAGNQSGEAACIFHLGHIYWWHEDLDGLAGLLDRSAELATAGSDLATSLLGVGGIVLAEITGDAAGVVDGATAMDRQHVHPEIDPIVNWLEARGRLMLGDADGALMPAERALVAATPTMAPAAAFLALSARWHRGEADAVLENVERTVDDLEAVGWAHNRAADGAQAAIWCALSGDDARAAMFLHRANEARLATGRWARALLAIADAVVAISLGDEARATVGLGAELAEHPLSDVAVSRAHQPWMALSYVLLESTRPSWDAANLHGDHELVRVCAQAVVGLRAEALSPVAGLPALRPERVRSWLPVPWVVELACGLHAAGRTYEAVGLLPTSNHVARSALHRVRDGGRRALAASASSMLHTVARAPARGVRLNVLGPLEVLFDGQISWPEQLNRRAARELLFLLVEQRAVTRGRAAAQLWPDLPDDDARNNLRVALSYLNRALEPDRDASDTPLFVEQHGERIQLAERDWLTFDVTSFDDHIVSARNHERGGIASLALDDYRAAVALYRGDYLADAADLEWIVVSRDRRRADFVQAAVRAAELLVAKGATEEATDVSSRAVAAEPWSEAARRVLAEAHLATGDLAAARRVLSSCYEMLRELGVAAEAATEMLARRVGMR